MWSGEEGAKSDETVRVKSPRIYGARSEAGTELCLLREKVRGGYDRHSTLVSAVAPVVLLHLSLNLENESPVRTCACENLYEKYRVYKKNEYTYIPIKN